ncbi:hypothetical protein HDV02_003143 [Globomyces sp. JEL0801]|nr:hypothetical protein HDV02_003143 [Globomyces sp. JEL0801]
MILLVDKGKPEGCYTGCMADHLDKVAVACKVDHLDTVVVACMVESNVVVGYTVIHMVAVPFAVGIRVEDFLEEVLMGGEDETVVGQDVAGVAFDLNLM